MIALKFNDSSDNQLELSVEENMDDFDKKVVQLNIKSNNNEKDEDQTLFYYFDNKAELNTFITWLVDMKKQIPD